MTRMARHIPVVLIFPDVAARQDAWGRLLDLNAGGATLSTSAFLAKGESVIVCFDIGGEAMKIPACVDFSENDDDNYCRAELRWTGMLERRQLARILFDLVARS